VRTAGNDTESDVEGPSLLEDRGATVAGLTFWGSPWQPRFCDWAFNVDRGEAIKKKWAKIPVDIDILVTHGPPRGILDGGMSEAHIGCDDLLVLKQVRKPVVIRKARVAGSHDRAGPADPNAVA
jgi:hypothetical protein